jgi:ACS family tartrate transporter-like MFS transporter
MSAIPLSLVFGSIISGLVRQLDWFELQGWRWIFIIQGILPIVAGAVTLFVLPNRPSEAHWLSNEERNWLDSELQQEHALRHRQHGHKDLWSHIGPILALTALYFSINISGYGLSTFMPSFFEKIVKSLHSDAPNDFVTTWVFRLTAITYTLAFLGMLFNGWHSDKKQERILHVAVPLMVQSFCILMAGVFYEQPYVVIPFLVVGVGFTHYAHQATFWTIPTMFLGQATAAAAIGFINMIGNLGASVGQITVGKAGDSSFQSAMFKIFWAPLIAAMIVLVMSRIVKQEKK